MRTRVFAAVLDLANVQQMVHVRNALQACREWEKNGGGGSHCIEYGMKSSLEVVFCEPPVLIFMTSGAGHGGRGGQGEGQLLTGAGYGDLFEPAKLGCRGGAGLQPLTGGRGAGFIHMTIHDTMKVDGEISCNGEAGQNGGGGGSGGSVWIHTYNMQVKQGRDQASVQARGLKKAFSTSLVQVIGASISARLLLSVYMCPSQT